MLGNSEQQSIVDLIVSNDFELNTSLTILFPAILQPAELLDLLVERFGVIQEINSNSPELWRILLFLKNWILQYWVDFDEKMRFTVAFLADRIESESLSDEFSIDLHRMAELPLQKGVQDWGKLIALAAEPEAMADPPKLGSYNWFIQNNFDTIADQLVLLEHGFFLQIDPRDFLQEIWGKRHLDNGLSKMDKYVIQVSNIVKTAILLQGSLSVRAQVFLTFLKIAKYLEFLRSYNSLFAIIQGLKHPAIWGLKSTLKAAMEADPKMFDSLFRMLKIVSPLNSFQSYYNDVFKFANPPCIPLVNAVKQRLIDQSHLAYPNEEQNFMDISHLIHMGDTLLLFESFKIRSHSLTANLLLQNSILDCTVMDEDHCFSESAHLNFDGEKESRAGIDGFSTESTSIWFN